MLDGIIRGAILGAIEEALSKYSTDDANYAIKHNTILIKPIYKYFKKISKTMPKAISIIQKLNPGSIIDLISTESILDITQKTNPQIYKVINTSKGRSWLLNNTNKMRNMFSK